MGKVDGVGVALQPGAAQKTTATAPAVFPPLTSEGIEPTINQLEHEATIGTRAPEQQKRGGRSYGGDLEGGARPVSFGVLLSMAYGEPVSSTAVGEAFQATTAMVLDEVVFGSGYMHKVTTAGTTAGAAPTWPTEEGDTVTSGTVTFTTLGPQAYTHIWNPLAADRNPLPATIWTINQDDPDEIIVDKYIGAMIDELAWSIEAEDYLLFTATIVAIRNVENESAPVITRDTTALWSFDEIGAEISVPSISAGAWAPIALYDWNHSYGNQLSGGDRFQIGSKEIVRLRPGNIASTVGFTAAEELESHYRRAIADEPELVKMRMNARGRQLVDTVSALTDVYESLSIEFNALEYTSGNIAIDASEPLEDIEIEANAVIDNTGNLLTVTLVNEHDGSDYEIPA
jgi:hypothetical protein